MRCVCSLLFICKLNGFVPRRPSTRCVCVCVTGYLGWARIIIILHIIIYCVPAMRMDECGISEAESVYMSACGEVESVEMSVGWRRYIFILIFFAFLLSEFKFYFNFWNSKWKKRVCVWMCANAWKLILVCDALKHEQRTWYNALNIWMQCERRISWMPKVKWKNGTQTIGSQHKKACNSSAA